jgi:sucrose phosphorylase
MDDKELFEKTGQGRDVNRHNYSPAEISKALESEVTQAIIALARVRKHPAFQGDFSWQVLGADSMKLQWQSGTESLSLEFNTANPAFKIEANGASGNRVFHSVAELANY